MTGPIPFSTHPRRVVHRPDGQAALIAIRRHGHRPTESFGGGWHPVVVLGRALIRWLRRDRRWLIELYRGLDEDIGALPRRPPDQRWVVVDHEAAIAGAETICDLLRRGEAPVL